MSEPKRSLFVFALVVAFIVSSVGTGLFLADRKGNVPISDWVTSGFQDEGGIERKEAYHRLRSVYLLSLQVWEEGCVLKNDMVIRLRIAVANAKNLIEWQEVYSNSEFVDRAIDAINRLREVEYQIRDVC